MSIKTTQKVVALLGGPTQAARSLNAIRRNGRGALTGAAVWQWTQRGSIPAEFCIPIERELEGAVSRCEMRPDIYPPEEYPPAKAKKRKTA